MCFCPPVVDFVVASFFSSSSPSVPDSDAAIELVLAVCLWPELEIVHLWEEVFCSERAVEVDGCAVAMVSDRDSCLASLGSAWSFSSSSVEEVPRFFCLFSVVSLQLAN
jgi:hypothetical protein